ncbi:MAG TPA: hypothetical protein VHC96_15000 [Puia sp.]|nr:hypothetical protein [Puia sp.]
MKVIFGTVVLLVSAVSRLCGQPVSPGLKNDICLPGTLYMLEGVQHDIFVEPLIKRWRPYDAVVRFSGSASYSRRLMRVASLRRPRDGDIVRLDLVDLNDFHSIKWVSAHIATGKPGVGDDTVTFSIIGDSFTDGGFFRSALLQKGYVPKIKMIGLRGVRGFPGAFDEGRSGWTLGKYFQVSTERDSPYNGFWQPAGKCRYWGATAFWKLAFDIRNHPQRLWPAPERYNATRFEGALRRFDAETGYLSAPVENDLMYDNVLGHYVLYDGREWNEAAYKDFDWAFNYGKYLSMWGLEPPQILAVFLGLNDFRNASDPAVIDFAGWNERMEKVIASYLQAVPGGKFVVMIPSSACGSMDNQRGDFTILQNACMWELRKNIIGHFDNRMKEHIYLVDAAIAIDDVNGMRYMHDTLYTKPYEAYEGAESYRVQYGNPHPYPNYPSLGLSLAAFIQRERGR